MKTLFKLMVTVVSTVSLVVMAWGTSSVAQVTAPTTAQEQGGTSLDQPSDAKVQQSVKDALTHDPQTNSADIKVDVRDHMVILQGDVKSRAVAQRALQLVANINGVKGVENQLKYDNGPEAASGQ
jgi:osmotically-inducible protein OsmY